jgi:hypothetical protein
MPTMTWKDLHDTAQRGVVLRRATADAGVAPSTYDRRRATEAWARPTHGAALLPGATLDAHARITAVLAAIGGDVAATSWTAAFVRGLVTSAPTILQVAVPLHRHPARRGIQVFRSVVWDANAVEHVRGVPTVPWARMLADLARDADVEVLLGMAFDGVGDGALAPEALQTELDARQRFPGRRAFRDLTERLRPDGSESGFELRARERFRTEGLPPDDGQARVVTGRHERRIDIPWNAPQVGVECHSFRHHGSRAAFESDSRRRNEFVVHGGWRVLELTWRIHELEWSTFVGQVRKVLAQRGWRPDNAR